MSGPDFMRGVPDPRDAPAHTAVVDVDGGNRGAVVLRCSCGWRYSFRTGECPTVTEVLTVMNQAHDVRSWADKIGRKVIFRYPHGEEEAGVVTSVGDRYVFVRFGSKVGSESCDPSMLRLEVAP